MATNSIKLYKIKVNLNVEERNMLKKALYTYIDSIKDNIDELHTYAYLLEKLNIDNN